MVAVRRTNPGHYLECHFSGAQEIDQGPNHKQANFHLIFSLFAKISEQAPGSHLCLSAANLGQLIPNRCTEFGSSLWF